ncbi:MAG: F0F1 ATP synthase subunit delta, partial [Bacteroidota bacterium]
MNESRAAIRYAKATLDYAVEKKTADKVDADMRNVAATISENVELKQLLSSPLVKNEVKVSRSARGAVSIAVALAEDGIISREEAILRIEPRSLKELLHRQIVPEAP